MQQNLIAVPIYQKLVSPKFRPRCSAFTKHSIVCYFIATAQHETLTPTLLSGRGRIYLCESKTLQSATVTLSCTQVQRDARYKSKPVDSVYDCIECCRSVERHQHVCVPLTHTYYQHRTASNTTQRMAFSWIILLFYIGNFGRLT